jgi:hypothetical protein
MSLRHWLENVGQSTGVGCSAVLFLRQCVSTCCELSPMVSELTAAFQAIVSSLFENCTVVVLVLQSVAAR